jgi:hypothetical protein
MDVELDWQVADDDGRWEPIVVAERRRSRRPAWWMWGLLLCGFLALAAGGYATLCVHYDLARRQAAFQIQTVVDLEAQALARGPAERLLAQQDSALRTRYEWQVQGVRHRAFPELDPILLGPARVQVVELNGEVAWVEVLSQEGRLHQVRFYRQTPRGWLHTAPRRAFWGSELQTEGDGVTLRYHERDRPYVEPLAGWVQATVRDVREQLGCPERPALEVVWVTEERPPEVSASALALPSPWLTGVPADGQWDPAALDELAYWVAYGTTFQCVRALGEHRPEALERAVAGEYATFHVLGELTQTPLLRRVVEQHGVAALPEALRAASRGSPSEFVTTWLLAAQPGSEPGCSAITWELAREANRCGQAPTCALFLALGLHDHGTQWAGQPAQAFSCPTGVVWPGATAPRPAASW